MTTDRVPVPLPGVIDGVRIKSSRHEQKPSFSTTMVQHVPTSLIMTMFQPDERSDHATVFASVDADSLRIRVMETQEHGSFLAIDWDHLGRHSVTVNLLGITAEQVLAALSPVEAGER